MSSLKRGPVLEVALVNNMPDAALAATAAQFFRLVRAGGGRQRDQMALLCASRPPENREGAALSFA